MNNIPVNILPQQISVPAVNAATGGQETSGTPDTGFSALLAQLVGLVNPTAAIVNGMIAVNSDEAGITDPTAIPATETQVTAAQNLQILAATPLESAIVSNVNVNLESANPNVSTVAMQSVILDGLINGATRQASAVATAQTPSIPTQQIEQNVPVNLVSLNSILHPNAGENQIAESSLPIVKATLTTDNIVDAKSPIAKSAPKTAAVAVDQLMPTDPKNQSVTDNKSAQPIKLADHVKNLDPAAFGGKIRLDSDLDVKTISSRPTVIANQESIQTNNEGLYERPFIASVMGAKIIHQQATMSLPRMAVNGDRTPIEHDDEPTATVSNGTQKSSTQELLSRELGKVVTKATNVSDLPINLPKEFASDFGLDSSADKIVTEPIAKTLDISDTNKFKIEFNKMQIDALLKRSEIKMQLNPPSLGSLKVKLVSTPQEFTARIETSSESAMKIVEQNLPTLREGFEKAGIRVDHIEVVVGEDKSRRQQAQNQDQRKRKSRNEYSGTSLTELLPINNSNSEAAGTIPFGRLNLVA